jgi:hypothetical protein
MSDVGHDKKILLALLNKEFDVDQVGTSLIGLVALAHLR